MGVIVTLMLSVSAQEPSIGMKSLFSNPVRFSLSRELVECQVFEITKGEKVTNAMVCMSASGVGVASSRTMSSVELQGLK
jgi:hypothetical protein